MKTPALDRWRRDQQAGGPVPTWLWRAACWEKSALEAPSAEARNDALRRAREIVEAQAAAEAAAAKGSAA